METVFCCFFSPVLQYIQRIISNTKNTQIYLICFKSYVQTRDTCFTNYFMYWIIKDFIVLAIINYIWWTLVKTKLGIINKYLAFYNVQNSELAKLKCYYYVLLCHQRKRNNEYYSRFKKQLGSCFLYLMSCNTFLKEDIKTHLHCKPIGCGHDCKH